MCTLQQKLISDFIELGCSERIAASTYQVYMELCEVKRMFDIEYKYDSTCKRIYLTARDTKSGPVSVFLPICSSENITFNIMEKMFNRNEYKTFNFAIVSADSTCVYYQIIHGLPEIDTTCTGNKDRTQKHDHELQNKRAEIEEALKKEMKITELHKVQE